eukprot:8553240-Lingulodinium_polyedra.AAC.1
MVNFPIDLPRRDPMPKVGWRDQELALTAHTGVRRAKTQWSCTACGTTSSVKKHLLKGWLRAPCWAPRGSHGPVRRREEGIQLSHRVVHASHAILHFQGMGIWICERCGMYAQQVIGRLAAECPGTLNRAGKQNLARAKKGLMPGESAAAQAFNEGRLQRRKPRLA